MGEIDVCHQTEPQVMMPLCSAFTNADKMDVLVAMTRRSYQSRRRWIDVRHEKAVRVKEAAEKSEMSGEKQLPESHTNGAQGEKELPNETELPDEKGSRG